MKYIRGNLVALLAVTFAGCSSEPTEPRAFGVSDTDRDVADIGAGDSGNGPEFVCSPGTAAERCELAKCYSFETDLEDRFLHVENGCDFPLYFPHFGSQWDVVSFWMATLRSRDLPVVLPRSASYGLGGCGFPGECPGYLTMEPGRVVNMPLPAESHNDVAGYCADEPVDGLNYVPFGADETMVFDFLFPLPLTVEPTERPDLPPECYSTECPLLGAIWGEDGTPRCSETENWVTFPELLEYSFGELGPLPEY